MVQLCPGEKGEGDDGEGARAVIGPSCQRQARSLSVKSVEANPRFWTWNNAGGRLQRLGGQASIIRPWYHRPRCF